MSVWMYVHECGCMSVCAWALTLFEWPQTYTWNIHEDPNPPTNQTLSTLGTPLGLLSQNNCKVYAIFIWCSSLHTWAKHLLWEDPRLDMAVHTCSLYSGSWREKILEIRVPNQPGQWHERKGRERPRFPNLRVAGFNGKSRDSEMSVTAHFRKAQGSPSCMSLSLMSSLFSPKSQSQTEAPCMVAKAGLRQGCFA